MGRSIGRCSGGVGDVVASSLKCSLDVDDPDCQRRGSRDTQTDGERERGQSIGVATAYLYNGAIASVVAAIPKSANRRSCHSLRTAKEK